jgi:SAM-dependent methyltransferase
MKSLSATRGNGALEGFLACARARTANNLIPDQKRNGAVLDIGCGSYPHFLTNTRFTRKIGLDRLYFAAVPDIRENGTIELLAQDLEKNAMLPFETDTIEVVTLLAVIEHLELPLLNTLFSEIYRVLKHGGIVIVTTPGPWSAGLLKVLASVNLVSAQEIEEHKTAFNKRALAALFQSSMFQRSKMRFGYFELGMNIWGVAEK